MTTTSRAPLLATGLVVLALVGRTSPRARASEDRLPPGPHHRLRRVRPRPGRSARPRLVRAPLRPHGHPRRRRHRGPRRPTASTPSSRCGPDSSSRPPATARSTTRWLGVDGTLGTREWRTGYGLAVSADGTAIGFAGKRGRVWTIDDRRIPGAVRIVRCPSPAPAMPSPSSVTTCKESDVSNGCAVYVNGARGWSTTSHGIVDRVPMCDSPRRSRTLARRHHERQRHRHLQRDAAQLAC